jgi:hypothetical protein
MGPSWAREGRADISLLPGGLDPVMGCRNSQSRRPIA